MKFVILDSQDGRGEQPRRNTMQYQDQPNLQERDIIWYLSARNVPGKPKKLITSWTGPWIVETQVAEAADDNK